MQLKNYGELRDIFCSILLAVLPKTNTKLGILLCVVVIVSLKFQNDAVPSHH